MVHELKIKGEYLLAIQEGRKTFEIRKLDRDFKENDYLYLRGFHDGKYTGNECVKKISYIYVGNDEYGLKKGFGILGII